MVNHLTHFEIDKILHAKMSKIYIFQGILTFVKSLIGIFVPVYLYSLGFDFVEIILYTLGISLIYLIMVPIAVKLIKQIGFKYTILYSIPIYLIHIICLNYISSDPIFYHLAWLTFGFYTVVFWPAFHSEMAVVGSNSHRGSQIGTLQVLTTFFASLAPLIGGFVLQFLGYYPLLIFSIFILILGTIPLLVAKDITLKHYDFEFKDYIRLYNNKVISKSKVPFSFEGIDGILSLNIWPVIIFFLLQKDFFKTGFLFSIISFFSVAFIVYIKSYLDTHNKSRILKASCKVQSFNWYARVLIALFGTFFLFLIESFTKFVQNVLSISYQSIFYNNAKSIGYMDYIISREMYLHTTKLFIGSIFIFFLINFENSLNMLIYFAILGIISSFGLSLIKEEI